MEIGFKLERRGHNLHVVAIGANGKSNFSSTYPNDKYFVQDLREAGATVIDILSAQTAIDTLKPKQTKIVGPFTLKKGSAWGLGYCAAEWYARRTMDNIELPDSAGFETLLRYSDNIKGDKEVCLHYPDGRASNIVRVNQESLNAALSWCVVDILKAARGSFGLGYRFVSIDQVEPLESMLGLHRE